MILERVRGEWHETSAAILAACLRALYNLFWLYIKKTIDIL